MEHNSAEYLHTVIEALSLSFADTLWYNADPSKIQVPVIGLLSKDYAAKRRNLIRQDRLVKRLYSRTSCERFKPFCSLVNFLGSPLQWRHFQNFLVK